MKNSKKENFLHRNVHLKVQESSAKVTICSFQEELGLTQVIKTSKKRLSSWKKKRKRKEEKKVGHSAEQGRTAIEML